MRWAGDGSLSNLSVELSPVGGKTPPTRLSSLIVFPPIGRLVDALPPRRRAAFSQGTSSSGVAHGIPRSRSPHSRGGSRPRYRGVHRTAGSGDPSDPGGCERLARRPHGHRQDGGGGPPDPPAHRPGEAAAHELPLHHAPPR